jgi:hypothetical protein
VGVDSYIAAEFANRWFEQQLKIQKQEAENMNPINTNNSTMHNNPIPTIGRDYNHAKQFACRRHSQYHISTMVFTIYYSKEDNPLYGSVQQRIRNKHKSSGLTDYFGNEFLLNIDGKEIAFVPNETHSIDILKKAWFVLTDMGKGDDLRFDEVKEWTNEN